jgi:hypothetical protein
MAKSGYPYTVTSDKFLEFVGKLKAAGVPARITNAYLQQLGFSSPNHRTFPSIMQFVGLLDGSNVPTSEYAKTIRGGNPGRARMATLIRHAYKDLFNVHPDAYRKDTEAIRTFFTGSTTAGARAVSAMVSTFQTLCKLADFDAEPVDVTDEAEEAIETLKIGTPRRKVPLTDGFSPTVVLNVNLQITLPESTEPKVYENLFAAMAKHLMNLRKDET